MIKIETRTIPNVVFIRVNTGQMTEVVKTVREALAIIRSSKPKGYHVYYVDYPVNHAHVPPMVQY